MNYLSKPADVQNPIEMGGSLQLAIGVANTLQSRYDANKAIVDQTIAQYESLRGINETDNAYIASQVSNVKNQVNKLGSLNLAHNTGRDSILNNMKNVLKDPIIQDILVSKANKDAYDAEAAKWKEKNPKEYSDTNYQYGLYKGGLEDYNQGKTKRLGSMSFIPKGDPQKELKEVADNIEKYDTEIEKTWAEGGYIYTQKGKRITEDKVRSIAETFLSDGAKKQLVINGWASIHQGATEEDRLNNTKKAFEQYKVQKLKEGKEKVDEYQAEAKKTGFAQDKKNAEVVQENYKNLEKSLLDIGSEGSAEQMYGTVYKDTTLSNFAKTFAYNTVDITDIKGDTTAMAIAKMEYDKIKDERDYQLELKKAGLKLDENGNPVGDGSAFQTKADFDAKVGEEGNVQKAAMTEIDGLNEVITVRENAIFDTLDATTQDAINKKVKNSKGTKTRADILIEYSQGGLINSEDADMLNQLVVDRYAKQEVYTRHAKAVEAEAEKKLDSPEVFKELFDKPNIKIMWKGNDGKDRLYSAKEVLVNNGMVDAEGNKIKSNPQVLQAIKKSMLADKIISNKFSYGDALRTSDRSAVEGISSALGEDFNIAVKTIQIANNGGTQYIVNPNTKTGRYIAEQQKKGGYNKAGVFSADDSFDDMSSLKEYFKEADIDEKNLKIGKRLMEDKTVSFGKIVTVMPGTTEYAQIAAQAGFNTKDTVPIEIRKIPNQPDMVTITVGKGSAVKTTPTEVPNDQKLRIEDLHPNVLSQINLYNTKSKLNTENFPPIYQNAEYTEKVGGDVTAIAERFYGGNTRSIVKRAELTTKDGANNYYFNNFAEILGTIDTPTPLGAAVKNMINSKENYIETQKTKSGSRTYIVPVLKNKNTTVFVPKAVAGNLITDDNADSAQRNIKFIPQDYFNNYLLTVLGSQNKNEMDKFIKIYGQQ